MKPHLKRIVRVLTRKFPQCHSRLLTAIHIEQMASLKCLMAGVLQRSGLAALHSRRAWQRGFCVSLAVSGKKLTQGGGKYSKQELRKRLTPIQYHVTQEGGTERAFTGDFTYHKKEGTYTCVVCGTPLFSSVKKFDSGSGWPSFSDCVAGECVTLSEDFSCGMHRVETSCSQCGAHLGHVFADGPEPTGKRYCINSASLAFLPQLQAREP